MNELWAITPAMWQKIRDVNAADAADYRDKIDAAGQPQARREKSVAVLSLSGIIEHKTSLYGFLFGGTSTAAFGRAFDAAIADSSVDSILIDVDSPGGSVYGVQELASKIYAARGAKQIVAVANPFMASAAYWIGTAADRVYVTPSGDVGSVGVMASHLDMSGAYEAAGVKEYVVTSEGSPFKGEWVDSQPVTKEYLEHLQETVNDVYGKFVSSLAKHRGVAPDVVRKTFGKGRTLSAKSAVEAGMADQVATFDEVLAKLSSGSVRIRRSSAQASLLKSRSALIGSY